VTQLSQSLVDGFEKIVRFVLLNHHVRVTDDTEDVRALHRGAREERLHVGADDVLDKGEDGVAVRQGRGQRDEARDHLGQLDAREFRASLVLDRDREILAAVRDVWERMSRIERQRGQDRGDLALKICPEVGGDVIRIIVRLEKPDAVLRELGPQPVGPDLGLFVEHLPRASPHHRQLLFGRQAVGRHVIAVRAQLLLQRRDAHHEELIEIRADDGEELHALEQWVAAVARLVENSIVERQPTQLAVDVQGLGVERGLARKLNGIHSLSVVRGNGQDVNGV
jgi:hypothetical protein